MEGDRYMTVLPRSRPFENRPLPKGLMVFVRYSLASVPWITLQRDIHRGYPQVDLEAQLSTDIHRWMMWISTAGYIGLQEAVRGLSKARTCTLCFKTTIYMDYISQSSSESTFSDVATQG